MMREYNERPQDFSRRIIAQGSHADMRKFEAVILQSVNAKINEDFYNKHNNDGFYFDGWQKGSMTAEHKENLSEAAKKRIRSKEHIEKLHQGRKNSKNSEEHTAAIIASRVGSKHTEEVKKKMSIAKKANPTSKKNASEAGKISAAKRPENYRELQSMRSKAAWAKRKEGIVNGD
jgi:hypothetical protein